MLLSNEFIKDIKKLSPKKKQQVISKLSFFEEEIKSNSGMIRESSSGFWIIGLRNGVYKFRLNIKDRILFVLKNNRENGKRDVVQFLRYVNHDRQIVTAENIMIDKKFIEYEKEFIEDTEEEYLKGYSLNEAVHEVILDDIPGILVNDEDLSTYFSDEQQDFIYYLSDEQYDVLKESNKKPVMLKGAGGTGKTIVLLNKLLGVERSTANDSLKAGYITYTELLIDNVQRMYAVFKEKENVNSKIDFISIKNFYKQNNYISNYEVIKWINENKYSYKLLKKYNGYDIFSEIHGIIKGYLGLDGRNINKLLEGSEFFLSLEEYENMPNSYSIFSKDEKMELHRFACNYQKMLKSTDRYDENDLTIQFLKDEEKEKYDYIVVDEVQDLNELQIYMIINMVKNPDNIIWAGDFNQMVNPTFFNFSRLSNIYYSDNERRIKECKLSKNFRTTYPIVELINSVSSYRKKLISGREEIIEKSLRSGAEPMVISPNEENLISILKNVYDKMYCAVITGSEEDKLKLVNIYPECKGRIFTIREIKGLEYKNIYCYNILSSNYEVWHKMFAGRYKNDESKRYFFNLFYVAISRAREVLCLYEDKIDDLKDTFLDKCNLISEVSSESINAIKKSSELDIEREISRLEKAENFDQANVLRLNTKLSFNDIREVIKYLKETEGYGCLIYDENEGYTNSCIGKNKLELIDILDDGIKAETDKDICKDCVYSKFCVMGQTDLLRDKQIVKTGEINKSIVGINNRINLFKKEENLTEKIYCNHGLIYSEFKCYEKAIELYTKAININKEYTDAYYCRAQVYKEIGDTKNYLKDLEFI